MSSGSWLETLTGCRKNWAGYRDRSLTEVQLVLPWVRGGTDWADHAWEPSAAVQSWGQNATAVPTEKWAPHAPVGALTDRGHPQTESNSPFCNFSPEGKGLTGTEFCSRKWPARRGADFLCSAAAGAFIWRGDERET